VIRDPIFGGIDWDGVKQLAFSLICLLLIISFGAATSGSWYDPYVWVAAYIGNNKPEFILLSMIILLGGYFWAQFESGRL
jgi:ABC-type dipeptide/oligopeptide/nickel transport system permease component